LVTQHAYSFEILHIASIFTIFTNFRNHSHTSWLLQTLYTACLTFTNDITLLLLRKKVITDEKENLQVISGIQLRFARFFVALITPFHKNWSMGWKEMKNYITHIILHPSFSYIRAFQSPLVNKKVIPK